MEVDIENFAALRDYLIQHHHIQPRDIVSFEKLTGGISNRTVKITWPDGHGWVLKQALEKLRVSVDWFSNPARIQVEAKALRWLNHSAPKGMTPEFIFEDASNHLLAMQAIPDDHDNWKSILLSGHIVPDHFEQFGMLLGAIHRRSSESKEQIGKMFADTSYFESLRLEPYYLYTAQQVPAASEFLLALTKDTLCHKDSLVHGDYSPKNTLVYHGKLILLDYEVVHFGDPAFDIGFAMAHFLSKAHHLPSARTELADAAELFVRTYRRAVELLPWAVQIESRLVRHSLGCLLARVAGKSQLEYLLPEEMARQKDIVLQLIANPPECVESLIEQFVKKIETYANN